MLMTSLVLGTEDTPTVEMIPDGKPIGAVDICGLRIHSSHPAQLRLLAAALDQAADLIVAARPVCAVSPDAVLADLPFAGTPLSAPLGQDQGA